jgi:hypothetical protein
LLHNARVSAPPPCSLYGGFKHSPIGFVYDDAAAVLVTDAGESLRPRVRERKVSRRKRVAWQAASCTGRRTRVLRCRAAPVGCVMSSPGDGRQPAKVTPHRVQCSTAVAESAWSEQLNPVAGLVAQRCAPARTRHGRRQPPRRPAHLTTSAWRQCPRRRTARGMRAGVWRRLSVGARRWRAAEQGTSTRAVG